MRGGEEEKLAREDEKGVNNRSARRERSDGERKRKQGGMEGERRAWMRV